MLEFPEPCAWKWLHISLISFTYCGQLDKSSRDLIPGSLALIRIIFFIFISNRMKWYYSMMTKLFDYDYLDYSNWLNNELMTGWVPTKAGILSVKIHRNDEAWMYNFTCLKWVFLPWITWYDLRALSLGWNDMYSEG